MPERNPPSWLQAGQHPSEHDRLLLGALVPQEGVVTSADLLVYQNATPNMSVNVAAGSAFVKNDLATYGGTYHVVNDSVRNLTIAAADATNPRNDLVVARIRDAQYAGAANTWDLFVIGGTPAATPVDPVIPTDGSYLPLARVRVNAAATSIIDANITDLRPRAAVPANVATPVGAVLPYAGAAAPANWLLCDGALVSRTTYAALFAVVGTTYNIGGGGEDATNFRLPDLRGRSTIGAGQGTGLANRALGAKGGAETHALSTAEIPGHTHPASGSSAGESQEHVHNYNHAHSLGNNNHKHSIDGDYGFRVAVSVGGTTNERLTAWANGQGPGVTFTAIQPESVTAPVGGGQGLTVNAHNANTGGRSAVHSHGISVAVDANTGGGGAHNNMHPFVALNHIIRAF